MRRVSFWLAVAGVSVLSNFVLEAITDKAGVPGLARFTAFTHRGNS
jgi:hypothetical protein